MDKITEYYYKSYMMRYEYDPFDSDVSEPYCYISDAELRYFSMAIDNPASDLAAHLDTLKEFYQQCVDEDDDEFADMTKELIDIYHENDFDNCDADEIERHNRTAERHKFLYDYYFWRLDNADDVYDELRNLGYDFEACPLGVRDDVEIEDAAARLSIHAARTMNAVDYTCEVLDCVEMIEDLYDNAAIHPDGQDTHATADELMKIFENYYGDSLYKYGRVSVEDVWFLFVKETANGNFDGYDYGNEVKG